MGAVMRKDAGRMNEDDVERKQLRYRSSEEASEHT